MAVGGAEWMIDDGISTKGETRNGEWWTDEGVGESDGGWMEGQIE